MIVFELNMAMLSYIVSQSFSLPLPLGYAGDGMLD
jgi:hypothetical protein